LLRRQRQPFMFFTARVIPVCMCIFITGCAQEEPPVSEHWLVGSWEAPAFDGELQETWTQEGVGLLMKHGYYVERGDTLYSEQVRIDSLFNGMYLLAQPRGGNPVIFRLTDRSPVTMTFENQGNRNPFRVVYEKINADHFMRTTFGLEEGDTVTNMFEFDRISP